MIEGGVEGEGKEDREVEKKKRRTPGVPRWSPSQVLTRPKAA